jgi:flagellar basal body-associated protein FliL
MKKKILIAVPVLLLLVGGYVAKTMFLTSPPPKEKISGTIYVLPKGFTLNLQGGRYATLTVALELAPGQSDGSAAGGESGATPPDGFGTLPEEPAIRDIITNTISNQNASALTSDTGREALKQQILTAIRKGTDDKVAGILFTDVAVQ